MPDNQTTVLILGANSDVAKEAIQLYLRKGFYVMAASRNTHQLHAFAAEHSISANQLSILHFDATGFDTHQLFYNSLPAKPTIVLYAAGYLHNNE